MKTNKKRIIHISLSILIAFSLMSAAAGAYHATGHECCGRCAGQPHNETAGMQMGSSECCPVVDECSCSLTSADDRDVDFLATSASQKDNSSNVLLSANSLNGLSLSGAAAFVAGQTNRNQRSVPIYLLIQSFLC